LYQKNDALIVIYYDMLRPPPAFVGLLRSEWFAPLLLAFLEAADYGHLFGVARFRRSSERRLAQRAWLWLARRDFPQIDWARVHAKVVYRRPASFYAVCLGRRLCVVCGEPLWDAAVDRPVASALIVVCRCVGLPRAAFPYAHTRCSDGLRSQPDSGRQDTTVRCHLCERTRPAVPIRFCS
jgi:hypothetical protein